MPKPRHMPGAAIRRPPPASVRPTLATLADGPPRDAGNWVFEVKFDGYRMLAHVGKTVRLVTRNGHDWTVKLKHLATALQRLKLAPGWLDGEIVALKKSGGTSFQSLQNAFDAAETQSIVYYLFDIPYYAGYDLTRVPLTERRTFLQTLIKTHSGPIRFSEEFEAPPAQLVSSACKLGLEGIIGKRKDSLYEQRRTKDWIKLKCSQRQEFVVGGWTDPKGSRVGLGSLLLGVHNESGALVYAGKVGTGFDDQSLSELSRKLKGLSAGKSYFHRRVPEANQAHWVKPSLLAEVSFSEWTAEGHLRHPVFHALRTDKSPHAIIREQPEHLLGPDREEERDSLPSRLKITHGERVIDPTSRHTKIDVIRYYGRAGELMMPHLVGRPVSLVRVPKGVTGPAIFQKHLVVEGGMEGVKSLAAKLDPEHDPYLEIASPAGLLSAAQMNVIEFHTWNATRTEISKPDRMTFDLDPGKGVEWADVQKGAQIVRGFVEELGLAAFLKTSGGKGLHVVTPLRRQHDWDTVKAFSKALVEHLAETFPERFVARSGPRNRVGKIFIDYLRNGFGATTASAWSVRARRGLGVSVPVGWTELKKITGGSHWTLDNVDTRLAVGNSPWKDYDKSARKLSGAMKKLGFRPS